MKNSRFIFLQLLMLVLMFAGGGTVSAQKLNAEEIIAKHLESIGSAKARKDLKNIVATGFTQYMVLRKNTGGDGKAVIASDGDKFLYGMTFAIPSYPAETFIYNGGKSKIAYAISNSRSEFGDFVYRYNDVLGEGLFGGVLSTGWALRNLEARKAKVTLEGTKKIGDREAHVLQYSPKGGSDLQIFIYIDQNSFEHLRTEYRRVISAIIGSNPDASSQQREQRQTLTEEFSDFKKESDINLPHAYRIHILLEGAAGTREYEYKSVFSEFYINQPIDPSAFNTGS